MKIYENRDVSINWKSNSKEPSIKPIEEIKKQKEVKEEKKRKGEYYGKDGKSRDIKEQTIESFWG